MISGNQAQQQLARTRKSRRRRLGVAGLSLILITGGAVSNTIAVGADSTTGTRAIAPYDPNNFHNGEAQATARTFRFNITQGMADIGMSYGAVLATYRDKTGRANAEALDLGVFPTLYGVEQCDGSPPILNPATFVPKTIANSNEEGSEIPKPIDAFMPGFGQDPHGDRVGSQVATATDAPSSLGSTESEDADMLFIAILGGKSEATTSVKDHVREARAVVTARELKILGGLFTFENPRWEAIARSGRTESVTGSFTFSRATVLGIPRSPEDVMMDLKEFKYNLEQLLAPLGAQLELPKVIVSDNKVEVTPMSFKLLDPPFGKEMIQPFLGNLQPQYEQFIKDELAADCKNEVNLMMGDIVLGILSGSGSAEIHAGGVDAYTDDTDFTVAPIDPVTSVSQGVAVPGTPGIEGTPASEYTYDIPGTYIPGTEGTYGDYSSGYDTSDLVEGATTSTVPKNKTTKKKTKSNDGGPTRLVGRDDLPQTKAGTAAVAVGVAGLLGALGLTFGEHLRERRTRRRIP